jgi:hypothetical protein
MTDRELLEAAAVAYWGDEIDDVCSIRWLEEDQAIGYTHGDNQDHNGEDREFVWNPLTADGDALRLLTKLPFRELYVSEIGATVSWRRHDPSGHGYKCDEYADDHGGDLNAATRRAIVRAAAAIGTHKEGA